MFDLPTVAAISKIAAQYGWHLPALAAVVEVESAGVAFAMVDGRAEPLIRFEGHYFDRRLSGEDRERARKAGLARPTAGAVVNPASQAGRWKLLARAIEIDAQAAYESVSWGVGQVMGSHWKWLGFGSVSELVNLTRRDVAGQVELMARYIDRAGLAGALARHDWNAFAYGYNGPNYRAGSYHTKMAKAYARWVKALGPMPGDTRPTLRRGARGEAVADLQRLLNARGSALLVDGDFGKRTENSVRVFQEVSGLTVDGVVGPKSWGALGT